MISSCYLPGESRFVTPFAECEGPFSALAGRYMSDIDLLVIGGAAFDPTDVFALTDDLHRRTGKEVDVYELCEIDQNSDFFRTIMREGVRIAA